MGEKIKWRYGGSLNSSDAGIVPDKSSKFDRCVLYGDMERNCYDHGPHISDDRPTAIANGP
jgi:hypothetical protein